MLFVALELRLRASEKNNNKFSYYLTVYENKDGFTLRISDHHFNARTSEKTNDKYTTSVTFSNENPEVWDYFKTAPNVKAIEYVYYEDKVTKDDLISIAEDIIDFVETGKFTPSVKPNEINESPKPTGNNLSGGLYTNKTIDSIEERIKSDDSTVKDMSILDIISKYNCYITQYPKKGGVGYELTFLYYYEKDGKKYWERVSNFAITQNVYRTLKNIHKVQTNPVAEVLWQYWVKEFDRVKYSFYYDDAKYCYLVYNIMGYWQDKLLKFDKNHPHVLHKYTRKTTAEEYINDINTYDALIKHSALQKLELQLLEEEKGAETPLTIELKKRINELQNRLSNRISNRPRLFINKQAYQRWASYTRKIQKQLDKYKSLLFVEEKKGLKGIDNWNVTELNGINFDDNQKNPIYNFVPSLNNAIFVGDWNAKAYNELCKISNLIKDETIHYERLREERFGGENGSDRIRRSIIQILGGSRCANRTFQTSGERVSSKFERETRIVKAFAEYRYRKSR